MKSVLLASVVLAALASCSPTDQRVAGNGCNDATTALIETLFYKGFSGGNMEVLDQVFHPDIHFEDPMFPPGLQGLKALVKKNNDAMSDWTFTLKDMICHGNKAAVRWQAMGRHTGSFMGESPTGGSVRLVGNVFYQIEDNKIVADWLVSDNLGFLTQIGVLGAAEVDMTR